MCLYVTRRYIHTGGRIEIAAEWVYCRESNRRSPCINVSRREETVQVGSSVDFPDLISNDGVSTVSSSMPATPISATSPAGPLPVRYSGAKLEDRSPSRSPNSKFRRYRLSFNSESRPSRQQRPIAPRPVVLQPVPPSSFGHGARAELPERFRPSHRRNYSDSDFEEPLLSPRSALDRARAQQQLQREERGRRRAELEADFRNRQEVHNRQRAEVAPQDEEKEHEERMLDEQERRVEERMRSRSRLRQEARRRREEETQEQPGEQQLVERGSSDRVSQREAEEAAREAERRRQDAIDREQVERLRRQIREGREREAQQRREREREERARRAANDQGRQEQREQERLEYERQRQQLRQQLEERERHLAHVEAQMRERQAREASRQEQLRRAQREFEELDRRIRARERRAQIDGPRFGERRNITATQSPHLNSLLGPSSPIDDADFRRSRGEEVLEEARRTASAWDDDDGDFGRLRVPLLRRNTVGGRDRARETNYRQRMRRYPS